VHCKYRKILVVALLLQDQFLDVVYWLRQIIGLIIGIIWGVLPLKGILGILLYVNFHTFCSYE